MTQYNLTVNNNANEAWDFCVFQTNPNVNDPSVFSLVWFHKYVAAGASATFTWSLDYSLHWGETGQLQPGVVFTESQTFPADPYAVGTPATRNTPGQYVGLTYHADQDFIEFTSDHAPDGLAPGSLYIASDGTVPNGRASVGIGMSGNGTVVTAAETNITDIFTPQPAYWVLAGKQWVQGQVLGQEVSSAQKLTYGGSTTSLTADFSGSHVWTV